MLIPINPPEIHGNYPQNRRLTGGRTRPAWSWMVDAWIILYITWHIYYYVCIYLYIYYT